jgi:AcrR family transcriptional regulator
MTGAERSSMSVLREKRRAELEAGALSTRDMILAATERLLADRPVHEITVAEIIEEAGIARGSFYAYFSSKRDVVSAVFAGLVEELDGLWAPFFEPADDRDPRVVFQEILSDALTLWDQNRSVVRAMHEYWNSYSELGKPWLDAMDRFTDGVAALVERREGGGLGSRQIAATAVWSTEQLLYVSATSKVSDLPAGDSIREIVTNLWNAVVFRP